MGKYITVAIQKGGTSKTTTAIHLAKGLADKGKKVLLVDMDAQVNATYGLSLDKDLGKRATYELFISACFDESDLDAKMVQKCIHSVKGLDVLPGTKRMEMVEPSIKDDAGKPVMLEKIKKYLDSYDYIVFDCPPTKGAVVDSCLFISDYLLIPVVPEPYPVEGMNDILHTFNKVKKEWNTKLELIGILMTQVVANTKIHKEYAEVLIETFGDVVFETYIRNNVAIKESSAEGIPVYEYASKSIGAEDYRDFVNEFIKRSTGNV